MKNLKTEPLMELPVFREIKEENLRIGIEKGRQEGRQERNIEIALNLQAQGAPLSQIAAAMGITTEAAQQLLTQAYLTRVQIK